LGIDDSTIEQLQQLAELRDSGAITDAEFNALKAQVLAGEVPDVQRDSVERPSGGNAAGFIIWWLSNRSKRLNANILAIVLVGFLILAFFLVVEETANLFDL
jgi:hypothetical protein